MPSPTSFLANLYAMRSGQPVMGQYGRTQAGMQAHEERFELEERARELEEEFQKRGRQAEKREGRRGRGRAVGSFLGAILGEALIPIPGVGAAIGAGIGSGAGQMAGTRRAFTLAHPFGEKRRPTLKKLQLQPLKGKFFKQGRESLASEQKDINRQLKDIDKMFKESIGTSLLKDALSAYMFAEGGGFEKLSKAKDYLGDKIFAAMAEKGLVEHPVMGGLSQRFNPYYNQMTGLGESTGALTADMPLRGLKGPISGYEGLRLGINLLQSIGGFRFAP